MPFTSKKSRMFLRFWSKIADGLDSTGALEAIATKRGCLRKGKGGELDREKAAKILLTEFRNGTLGRISLETPETRDALH